MKRRTFLTSLIGCTAVAAAAKDVVGLPTAPAKTITELEVPVEIRIPAGYGVSFTKNLKDGFIGVEIPQTADTHIFVMGRDYRQRVSHPIHGSFETTWTACADNGHSTPEPYPPFYLQDLANGRCKDWTHTIIGIKP